MFYKEMVSPYRGHCAALNPVMQLGASVCPKLRSPGFPLRSLRESDCLQREDGRPETHAGVCGESWALAPSFALGFPGG